MAYFQLERNSPSRNCRLEPPTRRINQRKTAAEVINTFPSMGSPVESHQMMGDKAGAPPSSASDLSVRNMPGEVRGIESVQRLERMDRRRRQRTDDRRVQHPPVAPRLVAGVPEQRTGRPFGLALLRRLGIAPPQERQVRRARSRQRLAEVGEVDEIERLVVTRRLQRVAEPRWICPSLFLA